MIWLVIDCYAGGDWLFLGFSGYDSLIAYVVIVFFIGFWWMHLIWWVSYDSLLWFGRIMLATFEGLFALIVFHFEIMLFVLSCCWACFDLLLCMLLCLLTCFDTCLRLRLFYVICSLPLITVLWILGLFCGFGSFLFWFAC